jgi:hypothetical protein
MNFDFPLPPSTPLAPTFNSVDSPLFQSPPNSFTVEPLSLRRVSSDDPASIHPVFIKSDLRPETGIVFEKGPHYPVDRLHPACAGYFNHIEYEAAMESIRQYDSQEGRIARINFLFR